MAAIICYLALRDKKNETNKMKQEIKISGEALYIEFYQKEENTNLSFRILDSNSKINEKLTNSLLALCKTKTVRKKDISYVVEGIADKLKNIIGQEPLYKVIASDNTVFSKKTKKEVYHLIQSKQLEESDILSILPNLGEFKNYNVKPFFFKKGRKFTKNELEYLA